MFSFVLAVLNRDYNKGVLLIPIIRTLRQPGTNLPNLLPEVPGHARQDQRQQQRDHGGRQAEGPLLRQAPHGRVEAALPGEADQDAQGGDQGAPSPM